jgi:hypothetical protein
MPIVVTIGGVPYDSLYDKFEATQELTYKADVCSLNVRSNTEIPKYSEIIVTDGTNRKFAGIVIGTTLIDSLYNIWDVQGYDYSKQLDQRLVVENYTNKTGDYIVNDIITKYVDSSFTSTGVETGAPVIDFEQFNYIKVSEAIIRICERIGWQFYVDYNKDIKFFSASTVLEPAPEEITSINQIEGLEANVDVSDLRNLVTQIGGTYLSNDYTHEIKSDGIAEAWLLPHVPYDLSLMEVNEVPVTIGREGIDDPSTVDFIYNAEQQRVTLAAGTKPADGVTIAWTYKFRITIITQAENAASQAAIAAIQGGSGIYEDVIRDDTIITLEAAEAQAQGAINQFSDPFVSGSYITRTEGYVAGQLVKINLPEKGLVNTYMVQAVKTTYTNNVWEYTISFGGKLLGVEDYLQALITNQQNAVQTNVEVLQKIITVTETVMLSDELTVTYRDADDEFYVEDSVKLKVINETKQFNSVGSYMIANVTGLNGGLQYRIDSGSWVDWQHNELVTIPHPCTVDVMTSSVAEVRNWLMPYTETDVITGEVVVIG